MSLIDRVRAAITPVVDEQRRPGATGDAGASAASGLVNGGKGPAEEELLIDGQEEVFSRSEVELGRIEHRPAAEGEDEESPPFGLPHA